MHINMRKLYNIKLYVVGITALLVNIIFQFQLREVNSFASIDQWNERFLTSNDGFQEDDLSLKFLLDVDGISVSTGREHICAIEQNPMLPAGSRVGGNIQCWGIDYLDRLDAPKDV